MIEIFENSAVLKGIYKEQIPSLDNIEVHEIKVINGEDLIFYLRFDLNEYPFDPPLKWKQAGYNTSQMSLQLIGSQIISLEIKKKIDKGTLIFDVENDMKVLTFIQNSASDIIIKCKWIYINGITGYLK